MTQKRKPNYRLNGFLMQRNLFFGGTRAGAESLKSLLHEGDWKSINSSALDEIVESPSTSHTSLREVARVNDQDFATVLRYGDSLVLSYFYNQDLGWGDRRRITRAAEELPAFIGQGTILEAVGVSSITDLEEVRAAVGAYLDKHAISSLPPISPKSEVQHLQSGLLWDCTLGEKHPIWIFVADKEFEANGRAKELLVGELLRMQLFYAKIEYYASMAFAIIAEYNRAKRNSQIELSADQIASSVDEIGVLTPNMETALSAFSRTANSIGATRNRKKLAVFADLQQKKQLQIAGLSHELAAVTAGLRKHSMKDGVYFDNATWKVQYRGETVTITASLRDAFAALWRGFPNRNVTTYDEICPGSVADRKVVRASEVVRKLKAVLKPIGLTVENTRSSKQLPGYQLAKEGQSDRRS